MGVISFVFLIHSKFFILARADYCCPKVSSREYFKIIVYEFRSNNTLSIVI
jgi:hypothetical protein